MWTKDIVADFFMATPLGEGEYGRVDSAPERHRRIVDHGLCAEPRPLAPELDGWWLLCARKGKVDCSIAQWARLDLVQDVVAGTADTHSPVGDVVHGSKGAIACRTEETAVQGLRVAQQSTYYDTLHGGAEGGVLVPREHHGGAADLFGDGNGGFVSAIHLAAVILDNLLGERVYGEGRNGDQCADKSEVAVDRDQTSAST